MFACGPYSVTSLLNSNLVLKCGSFSPGQKRIFPTLTPEQLDEIITCSYKGLVNWQPVELTKESQLDKSEGTPKKETPGKFAGRRPFGFAGRKKD